jgi:hypothetical protein
MLILAKFAKDKPAVLGGLIVLTVAAIAILAPLLFLMLGQAPLARLLDAEKARAEAAPGRALEAY